MVKKTVVKEYNVLDIEDVEKAVSEMVGRSVKIGEMDIEVIDGYPLDSFESGNKEDFYMYCSVYVDGQWVSDADNNGPLEEYFDTLEVGTVEEYIFNFNTDLFKSYARSTDYSD